MADLAHLTDPTGPTGLTEHAVAADLADLADLGERWRRDLQAWAVPDEILARAERSPWGHQVTRFADRADQAVARPRGWSYERAASLLPQHGSVLDLGCGAGAAPLPLAGRAAFLTGVDRSADMLAAFVQRAQGIGVDAVAVEGDWPAMADAVGPHDVVVGHHVVYDTQDLAEFLTAATAHARHGVVLELPPRHPMTWMAPLWRRFWDLERPTTPTADDVVALLRALRVRRLCVHRWVREDVDPAVFDDRVALVTRRLCLPEDREPEVAAYLAELPPVTHREVVTISWAGRA
jgi:SAM-dependent methyltransferase